MATIKRFEELKCWISARALVKDLYELTGRNELSKDYALKDQMRRAAISIMSNIAEGFERGGNKEFVNFLSIAKASAAELQSQLYIALDAKYLDEATFNHLSNQINSTSKSIGAFIRYLKESEYKGYKFTEEEIEYITNNTMTE